MNDITAATAARYGMRAATMSAERLFDSLPADGSIITFWTGYGHVNGAERFSVARARRADDGHGVEILRPEGNVWGRVLQVHPLNADRTVRTLVTRNA